MHGPRACALWGYFMSDNRHDWTRGLFSIPFAISLISFLILLPFDKFCAVGLRVLMCRIINRQQLWIFLNLLNCNLQSFTWLMLQILVQISSITCTLFYSSHQQCSYLKIIYTMLHQICWTIWRSKAVLNTNMQFFFYQL